MSSASVASQLAAFKVVKSLTSNFMQKCWMLLKSKLPTGR